LSVDGASLRRVRIQEIIEFVHEKEPYTLDIQNMMLLSQGMKHKTTSALLEEIQATGIIRMNREGRWTSPNDKLYRMYLGKGKEIGDTRDRDRQRDTEPERQRHGSKGEDEGAHGTDPSYLQ